MRGSETFRPEPIAVLGAWLAVLGLAVLCSGSGARAADRPGGDRAEALGGHATAMDANTKAMGEYEAALRKGDARFAAGDSFEAVRAYEQAGRIAYNNKLTIDSAALADRLAKARKARDEGEEGQVVRFLELTVPQATSVRATKPSNLCHPTVCVDGGGKNDQWLVTNPYLPSDRHFLSMIYGTACSSDGTLYVAGNGVVSATEARRPPRANLEWYADNGHGLWRVTPDGRVTAFAVGPYGTYPPGHWKKMAAVCNVPVAEAASFGPGWGGIAVGPTGDAYVSHTELHMILKLRGDGYVEHVAGGGDRPCAHDPWKNKKEAGYRDGPGKQALFKYPQGLAIDRAGNLFVADPGNCALRRIDPSGEVSTVHKGVTTPRNGCYADPADVEDRRKRINHELVVVDPQGRPVVGGSFVMPSVDIYSNVHRFHPDGRVEQLLSARKGYANTGDLRIEYLSGLAHLPDGRLLIADSVNNLLRTVDGKRLTDWLGVQGERGRSDINGLAQGASLRQPGGLCVVGDGTVFVAPAKPRSGPVRKVDGKTRAVSTWVY